MDAIFRAFEKDLEGFIKRKPNFASEKKCLYKILYYFDSKSVKIGAAANKNKGLLCCGPYHVLGSISTFIWKC